MVLLFIIAVMLLPSCYMSNMVVVDNNINECIMVDDCGEEWRMDYENNIHAGDSVTAIMYDCDTVAIYDDIILYVRWNV